VGDDARGAGPPGASAFPDVLIAHLAVEVRLRGPPETASRSDLRAALQVSVRPRLEHARRVSYWPPSSFDNKIRLCEVTFRVGG
jgi:hypothetical protein